MYVTAVTVNWGRGYAPGEFKANVENVLDYVDGREHVVLLVQELDEEPDLAPEHEVFGAMLEPGSHKVGWNTSEPIVLSPGFDRVRRQRVTVTMESGGKIGGPKGTGPTRHAVSCIAGEGDIEIGFGNTHPHRNLPDLAVRRARRRGLVIFRRELSAVQREQVPVIWGGDMNDHNLRVVLAGERTAIHRGNDYIRYRNHPRSKYRLELAGTRTLKGTIDPHDPLVARFRVSRRDR